MIRRFDHRFDRRVRVFPPDEVNDRNAGTEVDARAAGLERADVEAVWEDVMRTIAERCPRAGGRPRPRSRARGPLRSVPSPSDPSENAT